MNKHIELVKKWLDDPDSVTREELRENSDSAYAAYAAADDAYAAYAAAALAADYAADAADALAADYAADAAKYVKQYEELTGEFGEV